MLLVVFDLRILVENIFPVQSFSDDDLNIIHDQYKLPFSSGVAMMGRCDRECHMALRDMDELLYSTSRNVNFYLMNDGPEVLPFSREQICFVFANRVKDPSSV